MPAMKINKTSDAKIVIYLDHYSRRIRIDEYDGNIKEVIRLIEESKQHWVEKLIVKVKEKHVPVFIAHGYKVEAYIDEYYSNNGMYFVVKYYCKERRTDNDAEAEESILAKIVSVERNALIEKNSDIRLLEPANMEELSLLYKEVFEVYPTPLQSVEYLKRTIQTGTIYAGIYEENQLVSAASAETNEKFSHAEMTDCASLPSANGKGYMKQLLLFLEDVAANKGIYCYYTIARANSYAMNKVFYDLGYEFGGKMNQNCMIGTGLENMNVWYKTR